MRSLALVWLWLLVMSVAPAWADGLGSLEDDILKSADEELKAHGARGAFKFVIVGPDGQSIEPRRFIRGIPGQYAVCEFPRVFAIEGQNLFEAGPTLQKQLPERSGGITVFTEADPDLADVVHARSPSSANLPPGRYTIQPFRLAFEVGPKLTALHPAISVEGQTIKIHTVPVTFAARDARSGATVPWAGLQLLFESTNLLAGLIPDEGAPPFCPLTIYLPRGVEYATSIGRFRIDDAGKIIPPPKVELRDGVFVRTVEPSVAPPAPVDKGYWLMSHNLRRVFKRGEVMRAYAIVSGEHPAGRLQVVARSESSEYPLGALEFAATETTDARLFLVDTSPLAPGRYELSVKHPDSRGFEFEVVELIQRTPLFLHVSSACNGADYTLDAEGLKQLRDAHVATWITLAGGGSPLNDGMTPATNAYPPPPDGSPPEMSRPIDKARLILEETLRHGLSMIDYANRRLGFYNEGLAFHHSHVPSVERTIRRVQIFAQETEDFPAFTGMSYTWFPSLPGYTEGGVPTDPFFGTRMEALRAKVKEQTGLIPLTSEEMDRLRKSDPPDRALADRARAYWRAEQRMGWQETFALYNQKLREIRGDLIATTHENAGHDLGKSLADMGGAHDAMSFESYTDFGDWYISTPFVIDWSHGHLPGKPVWYTVDGTQTVPAQAAKALYAFARGAEGIGLPIRSPTYAHINKKLSQVMRFLEMYGSIITDFQSDPSVAVCVSELNHGLYHAHALYSHLLRLGYSPRVLVERTIERGGVPEGTEAVFVANLTLPFSAETEKGLRDFMSRGGKVVLVGEKSLPLDGAIRMSAPLKTLWDLGGFSEHLKMWQQFKEIRPALEQVMSDLALSPPHGALPEKAILLPARSGGIEYLTVIASPADVRDTDFNAVSDLTINVGQAKHVINLITGQELAVNDGKVTLNLETEPAAVLALLEQAPQSIRLHHPPAARASEIIEWGAEVIFTNDKTDRRIPIELQLLDPQGDVRATFYRLSGDEKVNYALPATAPAGQYTVRATELLTGLRGEAKINVTSAGPMEAVAPVDPVYLPHPDRLALLLNRPGEVRVLVEATQQNCLPDAERLVAALNSAGRKATLQQVDSTSYDTLRLRWFPRKPEERLLERIDLGELIGYRGNLNPFIDKAKRLHIPERGGWTDIFPPYVIRNDVVVFSGGRIADSLKLVSDWMDTPHTPGKGHATLEVVLSPFWADRHALAVVANDDAGRAKATDTLISLIQSGGGVRAAAPFAPAAVVAATAQSQGTQRAELDRPMNGFVPPALARRLSVAPDGFAAVMLKDRTVLVSPQGQIVRTLDSEGFGGTVTPGGNFFRGAMLPLKTHPGWHFVTGWKLALDRFAPGDESIRRFDLFDPFDREQGLMKGWDRGLVVSRDGRAALCVRPGGGFLLLDLPADTYRTFDEPPESIHFADEIREPIFATSACFSADGTFAAFTTGHYPSGYGGMGTYPPANPYSTGVRVIETATGRYVWRKEVQELSDSSLAAIEGCLAIADGGKRLAMIDVDHHAILFDAEGRQVLREQIFDWKTKFPDKRNPPPLRCELSADGSVALFASNGVIMMTDGDGKNAAKFDVPGLCDVALARDGARVYAASLDGTVTCLDRQGKTLWTLSTAGNEPRLALAGDSLLVAEGVAALLWVDREGTVTQRTDLATATASPAATPTLEQMSGPPAYREPRTLAILQKYGARKVAEATLSSPGRESFGKTFHRIDRPLTLSATQPGQYLVHLVYRHSRSATVALDTGQAKRQFVLDLPTPQYRVIDLPIDSDSSLTVTVQGEGLEVAELSLHQFKFPGNNGAFIRPAAAGDDRAGGLQTRDEPPTASDANLDLLDDTDTSGAAKLASGRMKNAAILSVNTDPDTIAGPFFRETGNPLQTFDGMHFEQGKPPPWTKARIGQFSSVRGSCVLLDLGYAARPKLCATYERTLTQSQVMRGIGVLRADKQDFDDPTNRLLHERRVLCGTSDNDQFFNLFELHDTELSVLAVYVFASSGHDHGLSEVELYD